MKKTLAMLLSLVMLFTALPMAASALEECPEDSHSVAEWYYYRQDSGTDENDCTNPSHVYIRAGYCTVCKAYISEQVPTQNEHNLVALPIYDAEGKIIPENYTDPTCDTVGYFAYKCSICDAVIKQELAPKGHTYGEWQIYKPCFYDESSANGIERRYCTYANCDGYEERMITTHTYIQVDGKKESCYGPGYTDYRRCTQCGTESHSIEIPQLEHIDADANGRCDLCFSDFQSEGVYCSCICHSESKFIIFIMPLLRLIWQLLGIDNCHGSCNAAHY